MSWLGSSFGVSIGKDSSLWSYKECLQWFWGISSVIIFTKICVEGMHFPSSIAVCILQNSSFSFQILKAYCSLRAEILLCFLYLILELCPLSISCSLQWFWHPTATMRILWRLFQYLRKEHCPLNLDQSSCCFHNQPSWFGKVIKGIDCSKRRKKIGVNLFSFLDVVGLVCSWIGTFCMILGEKSMIRMTVLKYRSTKAEQMGFIL